MPTIKTGMVDTEDVLANERPVDMSEIMHQLYAKQTQFTTMLLKLNQKETFREVIDWLEEEYVPRVSSLALSATSAATAMTVTTGEGNTVFAVNDVVRVMETGEGLLVTSVSANSIGVTRTWGGAAAASATSVAKLMIVGSAFAQGAGSGTARYAQRVRGFNYVAEQRDSLFFSEVQASIDLYGGNEPNKERVRKAVEHKRKIEASLFFGARDQDTSASPGPRGSVGGAIEYISTNATGAGGALTPAEMDTFLEAPLSYADDPVLFVAPRVANALSQMYRDKWQPPSAGAGVKYGAQVDAYINSTYGTNIPIMVKKEWIDLDATGSNYGTYAFLIDLAAVRLRPLQGHKIGALHLDRQEPSATARIEEYISWYSLEFAQEKHHGKLTGVTSYAAS